MEPEPQLIQWSMKSLCGQFINEGKEYLKKGKQLLRDCVPWVKGRKVEREIFCHNPDVHRVAHIYRSPDCCKHTDVLQKALGQIMEENQKHKTIRGYANMYHITFCISEFWQMIFLFICLPYSLSTRSLYLCLPFSKYSAPFICYCNAHEPTVLVGESAP